MAACYLVLASRMDSELVRKKRGQCIWAHTSKGLGPVREQRMAYEGTRGRVPPRPSNPWCFDHSGGQPAFPALTCSCNPPCSSGKCPPSALLLVFPRPEPRPGAAPPPGSQGLSAFVCISFSLDPK